MSDKWPVIVVGGTGYVAGEMLRLVGFPDPVKALRYE